MTTTTTTTTTTAAATTAPIDSSSRNKNNSNNSNSNSSNSNSNMISNKGVCILNLYLVIDRNTLYYCMRSCYLCGTRRIGLCTV